MGSKSSVSTTVINWILVFILLGWCYWLTGKAESSEKDNTSGHDKIRDAIIEQYKDLDGKITAIGKDVAFIKAKLQ